MALRITIDIFSGRENPVIELSENESVEALKQLKPSGRLDQKKEIFPTEPTLGYRGLLIEQYDTIDKDLPQHFRYVHGELYGKDLAHKASGDAFEEFVCGSEGLIRKIKLDKEFSEMVLKEIEEFKKLRYLLDPKIVDLLRRRLSIYWPCRWWWPCYWWCCRKCRCAPIYEPASWNDGDIKEWNNNCYNYASNYRTDTFAQPGRASGNIWNDLSACNVPSANISAKMGAISDDLIDNPNANNKCPSQGHLVALVIAPGWDYHWYRKGRNGYWSHKPGHTQVTNQDNSGNAISDPRTANRGLYTEFCTFMTVMHGHIKIK